MERLVPISKLDDADKRKELQAEWHWFHSLQIFTPKPGMRQYNFDGHNYKVKPWKIYSLSIGFGVKKGEEDKGIVLRTPTGLLELKNANLVRCRDWIYQHANGFTSGQ